MYNYKKNDQLEHNQIILQHIKRILEISSHELRSSERILMVENNKQIVETEDTRISYSQAVEMLGYTLIPHFDQTMQEYYDEHIPFLQDFYFEIVDKIPEGKFKEKIANVSDDQKKELIISFQVKEAKKLYIELTKLLKRQNFLTEADYSEGDDDFVAE